MMSGKGYEGAVIAGLPMDENLTSDIHLADFILDLSNVVRMGAHPSLTYFDRLLSALKVREKDPGVRVYAVADKSLLGLRELPRDDRRTLARWREDGLIEVTGDADPRILELAELTGLRVISGDLFIDRRDEHPRDSGKIATTGSPRVTWCPSRPLSRSPAAGGCSPAGSTTATPG